MNLKTIEVEQNSKQFILKENIQAEKEIPPQFTQSKNSEEL